MPLIEKLKNMDSWDEVKKEMEKLAIENNISMQELSSQIMTFHILESHKSKVVTYFNFYKKASQPAKKSIPKVIKEACRSELWCQTKMNDFWEMIQNLGEPKTSANFEEIEEDELFSKYWDKEHPSIVYQLGDTESEHQTANTAKIQMSDSNKQMYTKGATMIEKIGYAGIGPIGASDQGIWNPIAV